MPAILFDILRNRNSVIFLGFMFTTCATYMIDQNLSPVYLTNELKFSREKLSFVKVISAPANLICAVFSSHLAAKKPFTFLVYISIFRIFAHSYSVFVLLGTFPK